MSWRPQPSFASRGCQCGASLVIVLLMLIAATMLAVSSARTAVHDERAARNDRGRLVAFQAAEAALTDAELDIANSPDAAKSRSALFSPDKSDGFTEGCGAGESNRFFGLCTPPGEGAAPAWVTIDFPNADAAGARSVPYGRFTGQQLQSGAGALTARAPRYIIERLVYNQAGESVERSRRNYFYRVTAMGFGARDSTRVVLQTYYGKAHGPGAGATAAPASLNRPTRIPDAGHAYLAAYGDGTGSTPPVKGDRPSGDQGAVSDAKAGNVPGQETPPGSCRGAAPGSIARPHGGNAPVKREEAQTREIESPSIVADVLIDGRPARVQVQGRGSDAGVTVLDAGSAGNASLPGGAALLFDFTSEDDVDIGIVTSRPQVARFRASQAGGAAGYRYFVVLSGGIKAHGNAAVTGLTAGHLFLLSLNKPPGEKWVRDVNYFKFSTPAAGQGLPNRLGPPALLTGDDDAIRRAYAGDLQGNVWRFDFSGDAPWSGALGQTPHRPLFTAMDGSAVRQPVTTRPELAFGPGGGYMVLFGTGQLPDNAGAESAGFTTQSFYAIHDGAGPVSTVSGRGELAQRLPNIDASGDDELRIGGDVFVYGTQAQQKKGWYLDFFESARTGERSVTDPLVAHGIVFFNSMIPDAAACLGAGRSYALDVLTGFSAGGKATGAFSGGGLHGTPQLRETGMETAGVTALGRQIVRKKYTVHYGSGDSVKQTAGASIAARSESGEFVLPAGRLSWREVFNWNELHEALGSSGAGHD
ncbi:MAG: hypothetical protein JWQ23_4353 [Herminiimonas sp.]|nr:hypothetical protein [Herminiimonas sp.]